MKIYSKSTTTNKTKVKLLKLPKRIENNLQLKIKIECLCE